MTSYRYLRRAEVPEFLKRELGLPIAIATLAKFACQGIGGPPVEYFGRTPVYRDDRLLAWGRSRIGNRPAPLSAA